MSEMPVLTLPAKPSFMIVDGKTFLLEEVSQSPVEMLKSVEEYYEDNMQVLRDKVGKHLSDESQVDLDRQVSRIERHLAAGIVALPEDGRENGSILYLQSNKVYHSRIILFKPTRISCTMQRVCQILDYADREISRRDAERFTKFCEWARPLKAHFISLNRDMSGIKIDLIVEQDLFAYAMVAAFCPGERRIYCSPDNVHPHVHPGGTLCTGGTEAEAFWNDPQFLSNFNMVNPHSPANSSTDAYRQYKSMLKNQYFLEGRVREQEVSAWRV